ncbi:peptide MFS transporter [Weissella confusa]|uniref:peptide MFS transporter n=1 Tax=Weissella confusa TaxID=1583 RepID=UPI00107F4BB8|nr:peptide MFS transporter [Weissella confusa]TGE83653.1 hypothetical protein C6P10_00760 [Weissella confusa]
MESEKKFLGQPRGLQTLFMTEMWERFSYYGMKAILLYYMWHLIATGDLNVTKATAASIMAIYASMVYLSGVVGGFIADRLMGQRRTVFWGGVLIMFGHIALALPFGAPAMFASMVLIVMGTGLLKPNVSSLVGSLYKDGDSARDAGFSIFVFGINLGSFIAPLLVGWTQEQAGFHLAFSLAAIGMFFGLIQFHFGGKHLSKDSLYAPDPLQPEEVKPLVTKIVLGVVAFALVIIGEMLISPVGLSVTTKLAPKAFMSQMMSMWFLASSAGSALNAQLVTLYNPKNEVAYFAWFGIASVVLGIVLVFLVPRIKKLMAGVK